MNELLTNFHMLQYWLFVTGNLIIHLHGGYACKSLPICFKFRRRHWQAFSLN